MHSRTGEGFPKKALGVVVSCAIDFSVKLISDTHQTQVPMHLHKIIISIKTNLVYTIFKLNIPYVLFSVPIRKVIELLLSSIFIVSPHHFLRSKHIKDSKERYLLGQNTTCEFSG